MRYAILGTTQALRDDGSAVALAGGRLRALLTALALRPGRVVGAGVLIDEVWDGEPPAGASGALQALVGRLRRVIGHDALGSVDGGYRLEADRDDIDLYRFQRLAEEGGRALADGDPVKAAGLLGDALALWRGPALADLPDRGTAAVRSEALRVEARRQRLTAELALGRAGQVLPELAELAAAHPLDESVHALHIRALRDTGRTADALSAYETVRRALADELGADPSAELRALHAELLRPAPIGPVATTPGPVATTPGAAPAAPGRDGHPATAPGDAPAPPRTTPGPPPAAPAPPSTTPGLPPAPPEAPAAPAAQAVRQPGAPARPARPVGNARIRLTSFVGREGDLAAVRGDLERARLVTITGPGGTGKTRLSQEAGDMLADRWPDGVWYAELAPVSDPRTLPEAVISSLGLRETLLHASGAAEAAIAAEKKGRDATRQLADYCASRSLLLVLDNCEHVIEAAASLAAQLLAECPGVTVLATSREPLGVPGESVRPLDPLPDPIALRLLADRGAAARPGFSVAQDPESCAELCRRLDGLPLAIELAAARLRGMSPRQLADRLDDRFRLLTAGSRTLLPRQQTLRAVVDWSWDLLEDAERVLLRRLAVFRGGWTLEAVEAVCSDDGRAATPQAGPRPASLATPAATAAPATPEAPGAAAPGSAPDAATTDRIDAADAAALLASLVDKSLVLAEIGADGARYRMLETIAEYAAERLDASGERPAVERRHITYFREYARTADPKLRGAGQLGWFERLEREHENLRAALRRAVDAGDEQEALMLVLGCAWFWEVRNYQSERRHWPKAVAAMGPDPFAVPPALVPLERGPLDDPPPLKGERLLEARRHVRIVDLAAREDDTQWLTDPELTRMGLALIDTYPPHLPQSARVPGIMRPYGAFFAGGYERLSGLMDETVGACRAFGRRWELAFALQLRAKVMNDVSERLEDSLRDVAESRRIFAEIGDEWGLAEALSAEAEAAGNGGRWAYAVECCRQGIGLARRIGSHQHVPILIVRMGEALINSGRREEGLRVVREGIEDAARFGAGSGGAGFFGKAVLAQNLSRGGEDLAALALVDETIVEVSGGGSGVPGFLAGMLRAMRGYLIGRLGDPDGGLRLLESGVAELRDHPLADLIVPRLSIFLAPSATELLTLLAVAAGGPAAEDGIRDVTGASDAAQDGAGAPDADRARALARRAAALLSAHARLRPTAVPPPEQAQLAGVERRLRAILGDDGFAAAYADGDGLTVRGAVALMSDAPDPGRTGVPRTAGPGTGTGLTPATD